jgi:large subunit ribosomal protein L10
MANPRNAASVTQLKTLLADAKTFFLVDYQGLSAAELNALRANVRKAGGRILVTKNTLIQVVLKEQGIEGFAEVLQGPTALVLVGDDPVATAKAVNDFAKTQAKELPSSKGGMLQGSKLEADAISRIAKLPSREQLLSELLAVMQAPLQQLIGVLEGPQRNLVGVIQNYSDKLKEA